MLDKKAIVQALAKRFVERSNTLGYTGKRRDSAALDFFVGAAGALEESSNNNKIISVGNHLGVICATVIRTHGYSAVKELAEGRTFD
jgi:hypothetical protein